jgi:cell division protein FtsA
MDLSGKDVVFALDIGTRTVIGAICVKEGNMIKVAAQSVREHDCRSMIDGQVHDIDKVSEVVVKVKEELEEKTGLILKDVAIAAAGRTLKTRNVHVEQDLGDEMDIDRIMINSLELAGINNASKLVRNESAFRDDDFYCVGYSVVSYYLNGYPISNLMDHRGRHIGADVLATFLPQSVVNSLYKVLERSGLKAISLTLEPIAALEAVVPEGIRLLNIALIDIGAGTSDIAVTRKGSIVAYGIVPIAGDEITEAIAEQYLVDFNAAESMKRSIARKKRLSFKDITGTKVTVSTDEVLEVIKKAVGKMASDITKAVLECNGGAPRAVLCVGGGSQTPHLIEELSRSLGIEKQRLAVKNRESIVNLDVCDHILGGPEGVTVIGIAIVAFRKTGHDFINIYVNGKEQRIFNSGSLSVCDVLGLIGYSPACLIGRTGKNVCFTLNGERKKVLGGSPEPPEISINSYISDLDARVKNGDYISIKNARDGKDACPIIKEYLYGFEAVSFKFNGMHSVIEPRCMINGSPAEYTDIIGDGDSVIIKMERTIEEQCLKAGAALHGISAYADGKPVNEDYIICDGDDIKVCYEEASASDDIVHKVPGTDSFINVKVNGRQITLPGKDHIFIDIFNAVELDLSRLKGSISLKVNGRDAEYSQVISEGDEIEIYA